VKNTSELNMWKKMLDRLFRKKETKAPKNGKWKEFNKEAILVSEGYYVNDIKHGHWKQYYETGELLIEENYKHGMLHGRYAAYHPNGKILSEGQYEHGKREGFFNVFDESGKVTKRMLFVNNELLEEISGSKNHDAVARPKRFVTPAGDAP
jgi:antitoxin component YwqK of YwqJK toxin-antitoxin module